MRKVGKWILWLLTIILILYIVLVIKSISSKHKFYDSIGIPYDFIAGATELCSYSDHRGIDGEDLYVYRLREDHRTQLGDLLSGNDSWKPLPPVVLYMEEENVSERAGYPVEELVNSFWKSNGYWHCTRLKDGSYQLVVYDSDNGLLYYLAELM